MRRLDALIDVGVVERDQSRQHLLNQLWKRGRQIMLLERVIFDVEEQDRAPVVPDDGGHVSIMSNHANHVNHGVSTVTCVHKTARMLSSPIA